MTDDSIRQVFEEHGAWNAWNTLAGESILKAARALALAQQVAPIGEAQIQHEARAAGARFHQGPSEYEHVIQNKDEVLMSFAALRAFARALRAEEAHPSPAPQEQPAWLRCEFCGQLGCANPAGVALPVAAGADAILSRLVTCLERGESMNAWGRNSAWGRELHAAWEAAKKHTRGVPGTDTTEEKNHG